MNKNLATLTLVPVIGATFISLGCHNIPKQARPYLQKGLLAFAEARDETMNSLKSITGTPEELFQHENGEWEYTRDPVVERRFPIFLVGRFATPQIRLDPNKRTKDSRVYKRVKHPNRTALLADWDRELMYVDNPAYECPIGLKLFLRYFFPNIKVDMRIENQLILPSPQDEDDSIYERGLEYLKNTRDLRDYPK